MNENQENIKCGYSVAKIAHIRGEDTAIFNVKVDLDALEELARNYSRMDTKGRPFINLTFFAELPIVKDNVCVLKLNKNYYDYLAKKHYGGTKEEEDDSDI